MNKTFIVVLAICLVSVHAMVKRDAPAAPAPADSSVDMAKLKEQAENIAKQVGEGLKETFDPENIKKNFNELVDSIAKNFQNTQTTEKKA